MEEYDSGAEGGCGIPGYAVSGKLGSGSDSEVYECIERSTGRQVAVKVISKRGGGGKAPPPSAAAGVNKEDRVERSRREAEVLELLGDHPNIVRMHQWFETEDALYIVLDHAGGGDLFEVLYSHELNPSQTVLEERCARRIFTQTCLAVCHMHRKGVCHRDLKPENIFLDSEWNVKVGDFGLSLRYVPGQHTIDPVGSLIYASPEVLRREPYVGPELDVWALGILLYEMLCGTPPFIGETERDLCNSILAGDYTVPDFVSPGARSLISKMIKLKKYRISLEEVLKHPWIQEGLPTAVPVQRRSRKRRGSLMSPSVEETRSSTSPTSQKAVRKKRKEGSTRKSRQDSEETKVEVTKIASCLESDGEGRIITSTQLKVERQDDETVLERPQDFMVISGAVPLLQNQPMRVLDDEEVTAPGGTESPVPVIASSSPIVAAELPPSGDHIDEVSGKLSGDLAKLKLSRDQPSHAKTISLLRDGPVPPLRSLSSPTVRI